MTKYCVEQKTQECIDCGFPNWMEYCPICGWFLVNVEELKCEREHFIIYDDAVDFIECMKTDKKSSWDLAKEIEYEWIAVNNEKAAEKINLNKSNIVR